MLILGITFKENCPDIRNTKVIDIYNELNQYGLNVDIYDPWADREEVIQEYNIKLLENSPLNNDYQAVIVAVAHEEFKEFKFSKYKENNTVIFDTKSFIDRSFIDGRL